MSRHCAAPIPLPKGVELKVEGRKLHVKGSKGALTHELPEGISAKVEESKVLVVRDEKIDLPKAIHGLHRALVNNLILGVTKGFEKKLSLVGIGYRAAVSGQMLDLQLGLSHPTKIRIPAGVQVAIDKSVTITITGMDKHAVGQFAAAVRAMKPPEPYKGKGIRYEDEYVRKKTGKAAKGKTATA